MSMTCWIKEDRVVDADYRITAASDFTFTQVIQRIFYVGFTNIPDANQPYVLYLASTATDTTTSVSIPALFSAHPVIPKVVVTDIHPTPMGKNAREQAKVVVTYSYLGPFEDDPTLTIRVNGTTISKTVARDALGKMLKVCYTPKWDCDKDPFTMLATEAHYFGNPRPTQFTANTLYPQIVVEYMRIEHTNPFQKLADIAGKVNKTPFLGYPERAWLCRNATGEVIPNPSPGGNNIYSTHYAFELASNIDPKDKKPCWDHIQQWYNSLTRQTLFPQNTDNEIGTPCAKDSNIPTRKELTDNLNIAPPGNLAQVYHNVWTRAALQGIYDFTTLGLPNPFTLSP